MQAYLILNLKLNKKNKKLKEEEEKSVEIGTVKGVRLSIQDSSSRWVIPHYCIIINIRLL